MSGSPLLFTITGEWLTWTARNFMLDKDWRRAVEVLTAGIPELSLDHVMGILKGDLCLEGENVVSLETDTHTRTPGYKLSLQGFYTGIFRVGFRMYQPYAVVTSWGLEDADWASSNGAQEKEWYIKRSLFYADDMETDTVHYVGQTVLLCREVSDPPLWVSVSQNVSDAYAEILAVLGDSFLKEYGWTQTFKDTTRLAPLQSLSIESDPLESSTRDSDIQGYRAGVIKQTGDNWLFFSHEEEQYRVPRAPFEHYCLGTSKHLATPWNPVSPMGLKIYVVDNRYHTDWVLGLQKNQGGAWVFVVSDPKDYPRGNDLASCLEDLRGHVQKALLHFDITVLTGSGYVSQGVVIHPKSPDDVIPEKSVVVLPDASPTWAGIAEQAMRHTDSVLVVEQGGALSHLAVIGREQGLRMVRIKSARSLYPEGIEVSVDLDRGKIRIST